MGADITAAVIMDQTCYDLDYFLHAKMKERGLSPDLMEYILEKELSYMRSQKLRIYAGVILDLYNENEEKAKKEENPGE